MKTQTAGEYNYSTDMWEDFSSTEVIVNRVSISKNDKIRSFDQKSYENQSDQP